MHQNCKNYTFLVLCSFILKPQSWKEYKLNHVNKIRVLKIIETLNQSWPTVRMIVEYKKQTLVQKW